MGNGQKTNEDWFENDGTVNTISMARPFTGKYGPEPMKKLSVNFIEPGVWQHIGKYNLDHKAFVGHFLEDPKRVNEMMNIFEEHAQILYSIP